MGSAYWRENTCQRDAFFASAKLLLPYFERRVPASADVRPAAGSTSRRLATSSGVSAYHATSGVVMVDPADGPVGAVATVMPAPLSWSWSRPSSRVPRRVSAAPIPASAARVPRALRGRALALSTTQ